MDRESEIDQLSILLQQMGAEAKQADVMARQLSKRADQLAEREGVERMEALRRLLEMVRSGRDGNAYDP